MISNYSSSEFEDILIYFTHSIMRHNTEEEIAWDLAENCISRFNLTDCVIYFLDQAHQQLVQKAAFGRKNSILFETSAATDIPVGQGIAGVAAKNGKSELIQDTSMDKRYINAGESVLSAISVPIMLDNSVFGIIDCEHSEKEFFTVQHIKILEAIASLYAMKISQIQAERTSKKNEQEVLNIQKELLAIKIDALKIQMNPHFLYNAINSIQYFITSGNKKSALMYLTTYSKLMRYYLNNFSKDEVSIGSQLQLIKWYFILQKMRYTDRFNYTIQSAIAENDAFLKIPAMFLGTFIESILEDSLINNNLGASVKIKVKFFENVFQITALFTSAINNKREENYRDNLTSWQSQINLINRLRNFNIRKKVETRISNRNSIYINRATINIPVLE